MGRGRVALFAATRRGTGAVSGGGPRDEIRFTRREARPSLVFYFPQLAPHPQPRRRREEEEKVFPARPPGAFAQPFLSLFC